MLRSLDVRVFKVNTVCCWLETPVAVFPLGTSHLYPLPPSPSTGNSGNNELYSITELLNTPHCGDNWIVKAHLFSPLTHLSGTMKSKNWVNINISSHNPCIFPAQRGIQEVIAPHISPVIPILPRGWGVVQNDWCISDEMVSFISMPIHYFVQMMTAKWRKLSS